MLPTFAPWQPVEDPGPSGCAKTTAAFTMSGSGDWGSARDGRLHAQFKVFLPGCFLSASPPFLHPSHLLCPGQGPVRSPAKASAPRSRPRLTEVAGPPLTGFHFWVQISVRWVSGAGALPLTTGFPWTPGSELTRVPVTLMPAAGPRVGIAPRSARSGPSSYSWTSASFVNPVMS